MQKKESKVRVTGLVTPFMVRLPSTDASLSPSNFTLIDLKVMVGYLAVLKQSISCRYVLNNGKPLSNEVTSMTTSTLPDLVLRSIMILPHASFVKAAQLGGIPKVSVLKAWHALVGVNYIGFWGS